MKCRNCGQVIDMATLRGMEIPRKNEDGPVRLSDKFYTAVRKEWRLQNYGEAFDFFSNDGWKIDGIGPEGEAEISRSLNVFGLHVGKTQREMEKEQKAQYSGTEKMKCTDCGFYFEDYDAIQCPRCDSFKVLIPPKSKTRLRREKWLARRGKIAV